LARSAVSLPDQTLARTLLMTKRGTQVPRPVRVKQLQNSASLIGIMSQKPVNNCNHSNQCTTQAVAACFNGPSVPPLPVCPNLVRSLPPPYGQTPFKLTVLYFKRFHHCKPRPSPLRHSIIYFTPPSPTTIQCQNLLVFLLQAPPVY
jgi:hypothetical protein